MIWTPLEQYWLIFLDSGTLLIQMCPTWPDPEQKMDLNRAFLATSQNPQVDFPMASDSFYSHINTR